MITIREINPFARNGLMKIDDLQVLFKSLNLSNSAINLRYIKLLPFQEFSSSGLHVHFGIALQVSHYILTAEV